MDFLYQVREVRDTIKECQKRQGDEINYVFLSIYANEAKTREGRTIVNKREHRDIIKYLATKGFIEILEESPEDLTGVRIRVLPEIKPIIRLKTFRVHFKRACGMFHRKRDT